MFWLALVKSGLLEEVILKGGSGAGSGSGSGGVVLEYVKYLHNKQTPLIVIFLKQDP